MNAPTPAQKAPAPTELILPVCPSANRYWRTFRGRAVKSPEARDYGAVVRTLAHGRALECERLMSQLDGNQLAVA